MRRAATAMCGVLFLAACTAAKAPVAPVLADVEPRAVTITGAGGATLRGTLQLPKGDGKFPALVLVAGSGPTDRDGNQPPAIMTDLLKQIALALAEKGIATVRYDKRGMSANWAEMPLTQAKLTDFVQWENFVGDAAGAVAFLRDQKEIDPARVGILGHSEGCVLALCAAADLKKSGNPPTVLILASAPGRPMDVILSEQIKTMGMAQGADEKTADGYATENMRIAKAIRETGEIPADVPAGLQLFYPAYLKKFLHSELQIDPAKLAADYAGPVLLIAGEADVQVSAERDARPLDKALAARKNDDHALVLVPKTSHNLKVIKGKDDPGFAGPVAPEALAELTKWAAAHLAKPEK